MRGLFIFYPHMKNELRSATTTSGRRMAGARSLWRANGMKEEQFGKPIIGIANSFTQLVPGHTHLHTIGQQVKATIESFGCFAAEFDTIAIDDGIAMGHSGMLYSLPSRDLIADSIEYMAEAHCLDALVCISNCDKITPGMLMAAMRLNIPTIFVSGGAMEAGEVGGEAVDLIDIMVRSADNSTSDALIEKLEKRGCPTCGCCSGMFTANSMNCLTEALGMGLAGNGTLLATHANRKLLFEKAARRIVEMAFSYYRDGDESVLPRSIATKASFTNAMTLDAAMGGSSNTVLHLLAVAHEAGVDFTMADIDAVSRKTPILCKVAPNGKYHIQDIHRAGGIMAILGELDKRALIDTKQPTVSGKSIGSQIDKYTDHASYKINKFYRSAPADKNSITLGEQDSYYKTMDLDHQNGAIRSIENAYSTEGGLAVLSGNLAPDGSIVKTAGVADSMLLFKGKAVVFESQEQAMEGILADKVQKGDVVVIRYEGPKGGPGMQEMLYPTSYLKSKHIDKECALITDGRFSGGTSGLSIGHVSPEAAAGGIIAVVEDGDEIVIDIVKREITLVVDTKIIEERLKKATFKPTNRKRNISKALKAYAAFVSSADKGAIRLID